MAEKTSSVAEMMIEMFIVVAVMFMLVIAVSHLTKKKTIIPLGDQIVEASPIQDELPIN